MHDGCYENVYRDNQRLSGRVAFYAGKLSRIRGPRIYVFSRSNTIITAYHLTALMNSSHVVFMIPIVTFE